MMRRKVLDGWPVKEYLFPLAGGKEGGFIIEPIAVGPGKPWRLGFWDGRGGRFVLSDPDGSPEEFASPEECVAHCGNVKDWDPNWKDFQARSGFERSPPGIGEEARWLPTAAMPGPTGRGA